MLVQLLVAEFAHALLIRLIVGLNGSIQLGLFSLAAGALHVVKTHSQLVHFGAKLGLALVHDSHLGTQQRPRINGVFLNLLRQLIHDVLFKLLVLLDGLDNRRLLLLQQGLALRFLLLCRASLFQLLQVSNLLCALFLDLFLLGQLLALDAVLLANLQHLLLLLNRLATTQQSLVLAVDTRSQLGIQVVVCLLFLGQMLGGGGETSSRVTDGRGKIGQMVAHRVRLERLAAKVHYTLKVVDASADIMVAHSLHNQLFWRGARDKGRQLLEIFQTHVLVHCLELLQHLRRHQTLQRRQILLVGGISTHFVQRRANGRAELQRLKAMLQHLVQLARLRASIVDNVTIVQLLDEKIASGRHRQAQERSELQVLLVLHIQLKALVDMLGLLLLHGDRQDGESNLVRLSRALLCRHSLVMRQGNEKVLVRAKSVVQMVVGNPKHLGQLLVVRSHHLGLRRTTAQHENHANALNHTKSLLPKLQLSSSIQLSKSSLRKTKKIRFPKNMLENLQPAIAKEGTHHFEQALPTAEDSE